MQENRNEFKLMMENIGLSELRVTDFLLENAYEDMIGRMMVTKTKCICRLYLIEGFDFANKDLFGASDPYVIITCGKKVYNER